MMNSLQDRWMHKTEQIAISIYTGADSRKKDDRRQSSALQVSKQSASHLANFDGLASKSRQNDML